MEEPQDLQAVGGRIEALLDELRVAIIPREYEHVEDVIRLVTELYGAGFERVLAIVDKAAPEVVDALVADELVASLLVVHGLHPSTLAARVEAALESVRPFLHHHDGDVELLDIDENVGAVHLRLLGSCDGCPSSSVTLNLAVETAIREAAPEISIIDVEGREEEAVTVPVSIGRKQTFDQCPTEVEAVLQR